jgi:P-type conjugative transfer protein TrbJ
MKPRTLIAALLMATAGLALPVRAGIPVLDGSNLTQNIMTAVENVAQTLKQIDQYKTQLQQYQTELQNTAAPAAYIWDQAQQTINGLTNAMNTLSYYKNQLGSIDAYLAKFHDVNYYRSSPCFSAAGCSASAMAAVTANRLTASESQKKANDALFRTLDTQQSALQADARTLQQLQSGAQGANGQMQAIGYANQLASQQANQLLQIRAMLIAQQTANATREQARVDREAQEAAGREIMLENRIGPTINPKNWLQIHP